MDYSSLPTRCSYSALFFISFVGCGGGNREIIADSARARALIYERKYERPRARNTQPQTIILAGRPRLFALRDTSIVDETSRGRKLSRCDQRRGIIDFAHLRNRAVNRSYKRESAKIAVFDSSHFYSRAKKRSRRRSINPQ